MTKDHSGADFYRRSIRLKEYDYSRPGAYFITICTDKGKNVFGAIADGEMQLDEYGVIAERYTEKISRRFQGAKVDKYVIMPNHIHMIIGIIVEAIHELPLQPDVDTLGTRRKMLIPKIVGYYKMNVSRDINRIQHKTAFPVWQRNYYEHIIRNERELNHIRRYVINNPAQWEYDRENRNGIPIDEKCKFWDKFLNELDL